MKKVLVKISRIVDVMGRILETIEEGEVIRETKEALEVKLIGISFGVSGTRGTQWVSKEKILEVLD